MTSRRRAIVNSVLTVADFGANSLTTLVLSFLAARTLTESGFGSFGVATNIALFAQAIVQGGLIDVMMRDGQQLRGAGLWSVERFLPAAAALAVVSVLLGGSTTPLLFLVTGVGIVFLYVRTFWIRAFLVAKGQASNSGMRSLASLVIACAFLGVEIVTRIKGWEVLLGACIAAYALPSFSMYPALRREHRADEGGTSYWNLTYAIENLVLMGALQLSSVVATPFLGLSFAAGLRGASILFGPLSVLFSGTRLLLLPWLARHGRSMRYPWLSSTVLGGACALWSIIALVVTKVFGPVLLGASSASSLHFLPWVGLTYITQGAYMVLFVAGRAYVADSAVRAGRTLEVSIVIAGTLGAILTHSPTVYFVANAFSMIAAFALLSTKMARHIRRPRRALDAS